LYLVKIQDFELEKEYPIKKKLFPIAEPKAGWFTDTISIPKGECLEYIHMGYASTYEKELVLKFRKGTLVEKKTINHKERWIAEVNHLMNTVKPIGKINLTKNDDVLTGEDINELMDFAEYLTEEEFYGTNVTLNCKVKIKLDDEALQFEFSPERKKMSCLELLESIADEANKKIHITVDDGAVIYKIKKSDWDRTPHR